MYQVCDKDTNSNKVDTVFEINNKNGNNLNTNLEINPAVKGPIWKPILAFICFVGGVELIGFCIGISFRTGEGSWYEKLTPPVIKPPNTIFAPVWAVVYLLFGLAGFFLWNHKRIFAKEHLVHWIFWFIQAILNFIWTPIFFNAENILAASIEIIFLWIMILGTIILFWKVKWYYGAIMIPYISWVSFATALSWSFWALNR